MTGAAVVAVHAGGPGVAGASPGDGEGGSAGENAGASGRGLMYLMHHWGFIMFCVWCVCLFACVCVCVWSRTLVVVWYRKRYAEGVWAYQPCKDAGRVETTNNTANKRTTHCEVIDVSLVAVAGALRRRQHAVAAAVGGRHHDRAADERG